jgi:hypothetical protein
MTTSFNNAQNPETVYTSSPRSMERGSSYDGLVRAAANCAFAPSPPLLGIRTHTPQGRRSHAPFQTRQIPPVFERGSIGVASQIEEEFACLGRIQRLRWYPTQSPGWAGHLKEKK